MQAIPRPVNSLYQIAKKYSFAWREYDRFRQILGTDQNFQWPDWCFVPMAAAYAIISNGGSLDNNPSGAHDIFVLAALAAWRFSQGIYRFDPTIAPTIIDTPISDLPVDVLYKIPEWRIS